LSLDLSVFNMDFRRKFPLNDTLYPLFEKYFLDVCVLSLHFICK